MWIEKCVHNNFIFLFPFKVQQVCDSFLKCYQHVVGRYFVTYFQKHRFFILTLILRFHGNFHGKETYIFFKHCTFFCVFWLQCSSDSFQTFLREQVIRREKIMSFTVKISFREKNVTLESTKLNPCEIRIFFFTITTAFCFITLETPTFNTFDFNHDQLPTLSKFHQG